MNTCLLKKSIGLTLFVLAINQSHGQQQDHLQIIKAKAQQWAQVSRHVQGEVKTTFQAFSRKRVTHSFRTIKQNDRLQLVVEHNQHDADEASPQMAYSINSKYGFSAGKKKDGWILRELSLESPPMLKDIPFPIHRMIAESISVCYPWVAIPENQFNIKKGELINKDGKKIFMIHYENTELDPESGQAKYAAKGTFGYDVDANYSLIIVESESTRDPKGKKISRTTGTNEYQGTLGDFPRPIKRSARTVTTKENGEAIVTEYEVDLVLRYDLNIPESEFTLSAFGLPEPKGIIWAQPGRPWVWYGLVGFALVAAGVFLRQQVSKRSENTDRTS